MALAVPLTQGYTAWVDEEDAWVLNHKWHACRSARTVYAARSLGKNKSIYLHRDLMKAPMGRLVDHEDGDGLNCRRGNLRLAGGLTNAQNVESRARITNRTSPYLGVSRYGKRWRAYIGINGKRVYLGFFDTAEEANLVRLKAEAENWGIHPRRKAAHGG